MNPPCWNDLIVNNTFGGAQYGLESSGNQDMTGSVFINNIFTRRTMIGVGATRSEQSFCNRRSAIRERRQGQFSIVGGFTGG